MTTAAFRLSACGIDHKSSSIEHCEPYQLAREMIADVDATLMAQPRVLEAVSVSTCNRVVFLLVTSDTHAPLEIISELYARRAGVEPDTCERLFRTRCDREAAEYLFRVAAGIESMVVGENQILSQLKGAYSEACKAGSAGKILHRLFHQAFRVGKRARSDTAIGRGACSVGSASLDMIERKLTGLANPFVLFVGASRMIEIVARRLGESARCRLAFANRTPEKARVLAARFGGRYSPLGELPSLIEQADVVISCTSSVNPIIGKDTLGDALRSNPSRTRIVLDLATPRDVAIPKGWHPSVEVFDLEDIKRFVQVRQRRRTEEIPLVEEIIRHQLDEFGRWYGVVEDLEMAGDAPVVDRVGAAASRVVGGVSPR